MAKLIADQNNWAGGDAVAWVVMPDHVHVLVNLTSGDLSATIRSFKGRSSVLFNRATGQHGSLWQTGFYDYAVRKSDLLPGIVGYIAENPMKAGLVTSIADWPLMGGSMLEQWIEQLGCWSTVDGPPHRG